MLNLSPALKIFLCLLPTDMRRGFDGLMRMSKMVNENPAKRTSIDLISPAFKRLMVSYEVTGRRSFYALRHDRRSSLRLCR